MTRDEIAKKLTGFSRMVTSKHNVKSIFKNEDTFKDERERLESASRDRKTPKEAREKIKRILDSGDMHRTKLVIDEKKSKEYDKAVTAEMEMAVRRGIIPKPPKK